MVLTTAPKLSPLCMQWVKAVDWPLISFSVAISAPAVPNTLIPPAHTVPQQHWCFSSTPCPAPARVPKGTRGRTQVEQQGCLCWYWFCQAQCQPGHAQALVIDVLIPQWCSLHASKSIWLIWETQGNFFTWKKTQHFQLLRKLLHEQRTPFVQEKKLLHVTYGQVW